jgi:hypothetical protein
MASMTKKTSNRRISRNFDCAILHRTQFLLKSLRCSTKYEMAEYIMLVVLILLLFSRWGNFELVLEEAPLYLV